MAHLMHIVTLVLMVLNVIKDKLRSFFNIQKNTCHTVYRQLGNGVYEHL